MAHNPLRDIERKCQFPNCGKPFYVCNRFSARRYCEQHNCAENYYWKNHEKELTRMAKRRKKLREQKMIEQKTPLKG